jgi:hypothetical protein
LRIRFPIRAVFLALSLPVAHACACLCVVLVGAVRGLLQSLGVIFVFGASERPAKAIAAVFEVRSQLLRTRFVSACCYS